MDDCKKKPKNFVNVMKMILNTQDEDITCDECFEHLDIYVDKLQEGADPAVVLPMVQSHLAQCRCCEAEFKSLISILEGETKDLY